MNHPRQTLLGVAVSLALCATASAQTNVRPWYVGLTQDFTHDSNVLGGVSGAEISDTISTTTLRGGVNVLFGRQRFYANAALNHQSYSDLSARNNNGYDLGAGLDWSTVERLSGSVTLNAGRRQADFNVGGVMPVTVSNLERSEDLNARVRLGADTQLAFDAGFGQRRVSFTAPEFASREYRQDSGNLGLTYRPSGILTLGTGVSAQRTKYRVPAIGQTTPDRSDRQDVYVTATWVPTGASTVSARVNVGKTEYDQATAADFKGATGSLSWAWRPTGLLNLTTSLSRDTGQESGFLQLAPGNTVSASDFSRVTNSLAVRAGYELTGKINLSAGVAYARRELVDGFTGVSGNDNSTTLSAGATWAAMRTLSLGCNASRESRSASGAGSSSFDSNRFGCFGQFMLD